MDTSVNVLIYPFTTEVGIEYFNSLKTEKNISVFGAGSDPDKASALGLEKNKFVLIESRTNEIELLTEFAESHQIDFLFLAHDQIIYNFRNIKKIASGVILSHNPRVIEICSSKLLTYKLLHESVKTPIVFNEDDEVFPVFVKPDRGQGGRGGMLITCESEKVEFLKGLSLNPHYQNTSVVWTEYLPGKEFTVDCYTNKKRELLFASARERTLVKNGISISTTNVREKAFTEFAVAINSKLEFNGPWFFQIKIDPNGVLCLLEIGARIAGASSIRRHEGVNFATLKIVENSAEVNSIDTPNDSRLSYRLSEIITLFDADPKEIFTDYDDTLIVNGRLNSHLMRFLIDQRNIGRKITLLTKHNGDLRSSLQFFGLTDFFSEVIHIKQGDAKSIYLPSESSFVFIDDSYSERLAVKEKHRSSICFQPSSFNGQINFDIR